MTTTSNPVDPASLSNELLDLSYRVLLFAGACYASDQIELGAQAEQLGRVTLREFMQAVREGAAMPAAPPAAPTPARDPRPPSPPRPAGKALPGPRPFRGSAMTVVKETPDRKALRGRGRVLREMLNAAPNVGDSFAISTVFATEGHCQIAREIGKSDERFAYTPGRGKIPGTIKRVSKAPADHPSDAEKDAALKRLLRELPNVGDELRVDAVFGLEAKGNMERKAAMWMQLNDCRFEASEALDGMVIRRIKE